jgi:hypothetical protein
VFYTFNCTRKGAQTNEVFGSIYVLDSKQDAVKMLVRSQMMLQVNASKPQYGIGEQAYGYMGHGSAWITLRNGNIFAQVNVGVVDPRTVADPSSEMNAFNERSQLRSVLRSTLRSMHQPNNKSLNRSGGSVFRIKRDRRWVREFAPPGQLNRSVAETS